jgi:sugar lactone lactonase YvrE
MTGFDLPGNDRLPQCVISGVKELTGHRALTRRGWILWGVLSCAACWIAGFAHPARAQDAIANPPIRTPLPAKAAASLPIIDVTVDLNADQGPLETWRHTIGHGGINSTPLPDRVVDGLAKARPRLIRVFIQEFFNIYPERDRFDWTRLDPYMDALAGTGAQVVAAITIKPRPLYPALDQTVWRPNDVVEWQRVIAALVKRYSVDKKIVTYWEIGNETDIGENGGCPYLIKDAAEYAQYYKLTIEPIRATFPEAKVGGTGVAGAGSDYLPKFIDQCRREQIRLDFVSWHLYSDDSASHANLVNKYRKLLDAFGDNRPEMMVTEWSKSFDKVSVEEMAFDPRRAAIVASCLLAYIDAKVDWTFYYHAWDQVCRLDEFKPFFQNPDIMYHHWNEVPHRFGLFGVNQEVRPQYFVYRMLACLGDRRIAAQSSDKDLRVLAAKDAADRPAVMIVNGGAQAGQDRIIALKFSGLTPGRRRLLVQRIDCDQAWSPRDLELRPRESRDMDVKDRFACHVYCPADSVSFVALEDPADELFVAKPFTQKDSFTTGVEGPNCDARGNVYAVNFARQQTIGRISPEGAGEVFLTLPGKSTGNGIVFDRAGFMYVADYVGHNIYRVDPKTRQITVFAHEDRMNQPNDLAIAPDGTLYASDPNWKNNTGQVWRIDTAGKITLAAPEMGTANGIEVSPDGKTLYVNESVQRNIWAFAIAADGSLTDKRLVKKFEDHGFDGMRSDADGNLYVTRHGKGTVVKLSPADGKVLQEIDVLGAMPTNICFGGPDGKTAYVTEVKNRRLVSFRVDRPGLAWQRWQRD